MILIDRIDPRLIEVAVKRSEKLGVLKNSITNGAGNVAGYLGQMLVTLLLKGSDVDTFNYDVVKNNIRYEVKTKRCTSQPLDYYNCSITNFNASQKCDYYVFVRILEDYSKAWILGKKKVTEFFSESTFNKKGELDPSSNLKWKFRADGYNLEIKKLEPLID
jgi:hypothetical protein